MNKNIKIILLLVFTCVACFLIHDNVQALDSNSVDSVNFTTSNSLDNDLTNINNHFEIHPFYQFKDYKVLYCHDNGTTYCKNRFAIDSSGKIDVDFIEFLEDFNNKNVKTLFLIAKTNIGSIYETETPYIFFGSNDMLVKKKTYIENRPTPNFRGNTYQFLYSDKSDDNMGNNYYVLRKIGDKQFSFNVFTKDTYNLSFNVLYSTSTNLKTDDTYYIYSNFPILFDDGSPFVDSSSITVPPEQMGPLEKFIHDLFVPSNDFLSNWFSDINDSISKQMGFLAYPFTWVLDFLENFLTLEDTGHYIISWSDIKVPNFESFSIIEGGSFDLATLLENNTLNAFHELYFLITDALMIIAFLYLCINTYNRIFGGQVDNYEYISVDEGYNVDPKTGEVKSQWVRERKTRKEKI